MRRPFPKKFNGPFNSQIKLLIGIWVTCMLGFSFFVFTIQFDSSKNLLTRENGEISVKAPERGVGKEIKENIRESDGNLRKERRKKIRIPSSTAIVQEGKGFDNHERRILNINLEESQNNRNSISSQYDSATSPVPLVDPTIHFHSDIPFQPDMKNKGGNVDFLHSLCTRNQNDGTNYMLNITNIASEEEQLPSETLRSELGNSVQPARILCMSYTLSKYHDTAVKNSIETWGQKCDGYLAMSDKTDQSIPSIDIKHKGEESYQNMWQKVRSIWIYVEKHHVNEYDYFLLAGDDIYIIVENLRKYLNSKEILQATKFGKHPIFLGRKFMPPGESVFNSGGAGYILNSAALSILANGLENDIQCRPNQVGFWEDVNTAHCLEQWGVFPYDTRDHFGRERFLPFTPGHHYFYRINKQNPDWYVKYTENFQLKEGDECCSRDAISYHYIKGDMMLRMHALLYGYCRTWT